LKKLQNELVIAKELEARIKKNLADQKKINETEAGLEDISSAQALPDLSDSVDT